MMDRRRFLAALLGGAVLDKDRLLWRPGAKLISIPADRSDGSWLATANGYVTIQNQRMLTEAMYEEYDPLPRKLRIGDTIRVRRPERFRA